MRCHGHRDMCAPPSPMLLSPSPPLLLTPHRKGMWRRLRLSSQLLSPLRLPSRRNKQQHCRSHRQLWSLHQWQLLYLRLQLLSQRHKLPSYKLLPCLRHKQWWSHSLLP